MLFACQDKQKEKGDETGPLFPTPLTVELNTTDGYRINPITGDSIQPIINSRGERVRTGVAVPASGFKIEPGKEKAILEGKLNEWMGRTGLYEKEYEQIDDVVVMGIKI